MVSNYRKSPGRFGEIHDETGIERPPVRPSIAFPNARNVLHVPVGTKSATPSIENSDSTPATALYLSNTDADDMSSLGDDPSVLEIHFPASPVKVVPSDEVQLTNSQSTSRTMTTLMDLFDPTESPFKQEPQCNAVTTEQGTRNLDFLSDVVEKKKKKKKKKPSDDDGAKKTKDASEKKKKTKKKESKGEKSKSKESKPREDTTCTKAKKNESLDRKKKKSSPSDPSSPDVVVSSMEPTKKEKKKRRKSDESPPELHVDKTQERKQKKSSKGETVSPDSTCQGQKRERSSSKGKYARREKSSSHESSSPNVSSTTKNDNAHKSSTRKDASEDCKSRAPCTSTDTTIATSPTLRDPTLSPVEEKTDDHSFDERSFFSCARSTFTFDCFDLRDATKKHTTDNPPIPPKDIGQSIELPHRSLEFAIASLPKERTIERTPNVAKRSKAPFLKRLFGESHGTQ